ncbi:MAG: thioredoxin family protein [Ignavibacteria bacterium]
MSLNGTCSSQHSGKIDDFTLKNHDGTEYTLSKEKDSKAVVIMFWSVRCPYVQAYNDRIPSFVKEYQEKGITFWAINSNVTEDTEEIKANAAEHSYNFPVLIDVNSKVADKFGATRTPEIFVLDKDRNILYHGRIDDNRQKEKVTVYDLKNALDEILAGNEVTVKETKSFGCTIKRAGD